MVTLDIMKKLEEWSGKLEEWITKNYANPLLWVGILIFGVILLKSVKECISYGANTFMFYTGAPQNTVRRDIDNNMTIEAHNLMLNENINIDDVIVHAPYIINLANDKNHDFNVNFLKEEIKRVEKLGISKLVLHPGSHVGLGIDKGIENIIRGLNDSITEDMNLTICLETMAGKGSEVGSNFDELKRIIDGVKYNNKIAICMDTCHINDAGYDISNIDNILEEFDNIIGLDRLKVLHINDSKNIIGARKDRHENIGYGTIGFDNLLKVIYHEKLKDVPKILETPYVDTEIGKLAPYKVEIKMIRDKKFNSNLVNDIVLENK